MVEANQPKQSEKGTGAVRVGWLKVMYLANVFISLPIGASVLVAPETMRSVLSVPAGDPIHYGIASGAIPFAFGVAGTLGLQFPVRLSPVLGLQLLYKIAFLIGGVLPMALEESVPGYAAPVIGIFVLFAIGDAIAAPFQHLLSRSAPR